MSSNLDAIDREYQADEERAKKALQHFVKRWDLDPGVLVDEVWDWIERARNLHCPDMDRPPHRECVCDACEAYHAQPVDRPHCIGDGGA